MEDTTNPIDAAIDATEGPGIAATAGALVEASLTAKADGVVPTTVTIEGKQYTLEEAQAHLESLITGKAPAPVEKFDITKPRLIEAVPIELDRTRHMRLPFWALKKFQEVTGLSPWDHSRVWSYPPDMDALVALIWVSLLDEDDTVTLEQVYRMPNMDFGQVHYLRYCLDECWGRNQPDPDPTPVNGALPNSKKPAQPGSNIGPSRGTTSG